MSASDVIALLKNEAEPGFILKMQHFGIDTTLALGVRIPSIRNIAKQLGKNHALAIELWNTNIHEARILASMVADYRLFTNELFDAWVADFNAWDVCDQACFNVLDKVAFAIDKIPVYATDEREYVKRTAFTLIAGMAIHHKKVSDDFFGTLLPLLEQQAYDDRNFVKKAVNWALRQIGKRSEALRLKALETAYRIEPQPYKAAKWIAKDAIRELNNEKIIKNIERKSKR